MTDDLNPEGRTAHECFELARIALDQAEQVLNRATTTLECDKATASAAISRGWSALGDALANEPREIAAGRSSFSDRVETHRLGLTDYCPACTMTREQAYASAAQGQICRPGPHWGGPIPIKLTDYIDRDLNPLVRVPPRLDAHEHGLNCRHQWITPAAPCANGCGAMPEQFYIGSSGQPSEVCPSSTCPDVTA